MGGALSTAEKFAKVVKFCSKLAGAMAGPEPQGLPLQNPGGLLDALEDTSLNKIALDVKRGCFNGITVDKANAFAKSVYNGLPSQIQSATPGALLKASFEFSDWLGKVDYMELQIDGRMHFFLFVSEGSQDGKTVNLAVVHVAGPADLTTEQLAAKMIKQNLVGYNPDTKKFALAVGSS